MFLIPFSLTKLGFGAVIFYFVSHGNLSVSKLSVSEQYDHVHYLGDALCCANFVSQNLPLEPYEGALQFKKSQTYESAYETYIWP